MNIQEVHQSPEQKLKYVKTYVHKLLGKQKSEQQEFLPLNNIEIPTSAPQSSNDLQVAIQETQPQDYDPRYSQYGAHPQPGWIQFQLHKSVIPSVDTRESGSIIVRMVLSVVC